MCAARWRELMFPGAAVTLRTRWRLLGNELVKGFTRRGRLKNALADLRLNLGTAPVAFTGEVVEGFEDLADKLDLAPPTYRRMMMRKGSRHRLTHLSEPLLLLEGCAFFIHLTDRLAYRQGSQALRDACDRPMHEAIELVTRIIHVADEDDASPLRHLVPDHILGVIDARADVYAGAKTLLGPGDDPNDPNGLVALAALTIAESACEAAEPVLKTIVSALLLESIVRVNWSSLVNAVETSL